MTKKHTIILKVTTSLLLLLVGIGAIHQCQFSSSDTSADACHAVLYGQSTHNTTPSYRRTYTLSKVKADKSAGVDVAMILVIGLIVWTGKMLSFKKEEGQKNTVFKEKKRNNVQDNTNVPAGIMNLQIKSTQKQTKWAINVSGGKSLKITPLKRASVKEETRKHSDVDSPKDRNNDALGLKKEKHKHAGNIIPSTPAPNEFQAFVKTLNNKTYTIELTSNTTIPELKNIIYAKTGILPEYQRLIFEGRQIEGNKALSTYGIQRKSRIHLVQRLYHYFQLDGGNLNEIIRYDVKDDKIEEQPIAYLKQKWNLSAKQSLYFQGKKLDDTMKIKDFISDKNNRPEAFGKYTLQTSTSNSNDNNATTAPQDN